MKQSFRLNEIQVELKLVNGSKSRLMNFAIGKMETLTSEISFTSCDINYRIKTVDSSCTDNLTCSPFIFKANT